jgi:hypothetical protein
MPIINRKNISRARDIETFQNRNLTSTTVTFWIMNIAARLTRIRTNINLRFIFFTYAPATGHQQSNMSE